MPGVPLRGVFYGWWIVVAVTLIITISNGLANFTFGLLVVPMAADLGVSRGLIGWLPTARLVGNSGMNIVLGPLVDRHGARVLLAIAAAIAAAILFAISRAPSYALVLALFFVLGAFDFSMPGHVLTAVPVAKWFVRRRGQAIGYIGVGVAAGGIFYSFFHQYLIENLGWRGALAISAGIIVVTIIPISLLLLRRQPEDMGLEPDGERQGPAQGPLTWSGEVQWTRAEAIRTSAFRKLVAAYLLANFAVSGFLVHRAGMWEDGGLSPAVIASAFALDSLAFGFGAVGTGYLVGRVPSRFIAAGATLLQAATIAVMVAWVNAPVAIMVAMIFGIGGGSAVTLQTVLWAEYYGRASLGSIRGIVFPATMIGFGLGPPAIGILYGSTGQSYVVGFAISVGALIAAAMLLIWARRPQKEPEPLAAVVEG